MAKPGICPPSTNWSTSLAVGYTPKTAAWITAKKDSCYANPKAGVSLSKVHSHMRQLRVVVITLHEKADLINKEIKLLTKIKKGIARCLHDINNELSSKRTDAMIKRPRFVKNRMRETLASFRERNDDVVRMDRKQMLHAQRNLRNQYSLVREELQKLAIIQKQITYTILERSRILNMFPDIIAASMKYRDDMEDMQRRKDYQHMFQYVSSRPGLYKANCTKEERRRPSQPRHKTQQRAKSARPQRPTAETIAVPTVKSEVALMKQPKIAEGNQANMRMPKQAWGKDEDHCLCEINVGAFTAMTSECHEVIMSVEESYRASRVLRKTLLEVVEESLLVPSSSKEAEKLKTSQHGRFYGNACGGKCPRKRNIAKWFM
ncbi:unnamed protein product [Clavelina lepadiformis]|uniref:Uncharacterized protein n=1 Tax=Clavelina lepadiformis TaxID=159417 RepID=A0ABP0F061_CLALP